MITAAQIAQGAITDTKVGKNANIKHSKLEKAGEGEVLVAQEDGRLKAVRVTGDARLSRSGKLTINLPESGEQSIVDTSKLVQKSDLKEGKTLVGGATRPEEVAVGSGANAIPQRDSSGNLKAETADQAANATNADKLDNQNGTYYTDASNHTAGTSVAISTSNGGIAGTSQTIPLTMITASSTGTSSNTTDYIVEHGLGNVPLDVKVFEGNEEVETEVVSTTTTSTIKFSKPDVTFTTKIFGLKS